MSKRNIKAIENDRLVIDLCFLIFMVGLLFFIKIFNTRRSVEHGTRALTALG